MENKDSNKVLYLEGLRGIASLMVFFLHFVLAFFPAAQRGNPMQVHNDFELWLANSPFNIIYSGNFAVCIFFVLSGYVLSAGFFKLGSKEKIIKSFLKRYIRLEIPIFFSMFTSFLLLKFNLYSNIEASKVTLSFNWLERNWIIEPNFINMLKESFVTLFLKNEYFYNSNLWTMQIELFGSYLVYLLLFTFGKNKARPIIYFIAVIFFWKTFYLAFILGVIISDLANTKENYLNKFKSKSIAGLFLILGLTLGSFNIVDNNLFYRLIKLDILFTQYKIIGAFFIVLSVLCSDVIQKILLNPIPQFLGKISFPLYLIHLIIIGSFSCGLFLYLINILSYNLSVIVVFISTSCLVFTVSWYMYKYIDLLGIKIANVFAEKVVIMWMRRKELSKRTL